MPQEAQCKIGGGKLSPEAHLPPFPQKTPPDAPNDNLQLILQLSAPESWQEAARFQ